MKRKAVRMWAAWNKRGPLVFGRRKTDARWAALLRGMIPGRRGNNGCDLVEVEIRPVRVAEIERRPVRVKRKKARRAK